MRRILALVALLTVISAHAALAALAEKGGSMLSIGLSQGTADVYDPADAGAYISAFQTPELGVTAEYWIPFSSDYSLAVQGTLGFSSETDQPGRDLPAGSPDRKFSTSSFKLRVGGDRVGKIGERFTWFMGPGIEFWSGKAKWKDFGGPFGANTETETVTRLAVNGRFGGVMKLSDQLGIQGQIGNSFGHASAEDAGSKVTWWPSSFTASWGLAISF